MSSEPDSWTARTNVQLERKGSALWVTLSRPGLRNALDLTTTLELASALREANRDETSRCVVLTGAGEDFCGGGDVSTIKTLDDYVRYAGAFAEIDDAVTALRKPFITRIRGRATAGGTALAILADVAIASDDSLFGTPEIVFGMFPLMAMSVIAHEIGQKECWKMFYSGELFGTQKARELGILTESVPTAAELDARVDHWVSQISRGSPLALSVGRGLYYELRTRTREQSIRLGGQALIDLLEQRKTPLETPEHLKG